MQTIYLSFDGVARGGFETLPQAGPRSPWDSNVLDTHYNNRGIFGNETEVLLIETAKKPDTPTLVYYQYLRYKGVMDVAGRENSVFGVSLATDTFCPDTGMIFSLFRGIFEKCVIGGKIVTRQANGTLQTTMGLLQQAEETLKQAEEKIVNILTAYLNQGLLSDMAIKGWAVSPPLSSNNKSQLLVRLNPGDATGESLASLLKAGKKVAVSADFPLQSVKKQIDEANAAVQLARNEAAALSTQVAAQSTTISSQKQELADLKKELREASASVGKKERKLKDDIERLQKQIQENEQAHQAELKKFQAQGNVSCQQQLDSIRANLANITASGRQDNQPKGFKLSITDMAIGAIAALLVGFCCFFLGRCTTPEGDSKPEREQDEKTENSVDSSATSQNEPEVRIKIPGSDPEAMGYDPNKQNETFGTNGEHSGEGSTFSTNASEGSGQGQ